MDERGALCELLDERWGWSKEPLVYSYLWTVRPGITKGWGFHMEHEDRYAILFGEVEVLLYDERPDSSTRGQVCSVVLSEFRRRLSNIPAEVWHATRNLGGKDAGLVNFPTKPYEHENPDKYRLPLNNDRIPYCSRPLAAGSRPVADEPGRQAGGERPSANLQSARNACVRHSVGARADVYRLRVARRRRRL